MSNHMKVPSVFFEYHLEQSPEKKTKAPSMSSSSNKDNRKKTLPKKKLECYQCKGPHKVVNCPNKKPECYWPKVVNCPNKKPECYRCKGPHKVVNCPNKKPECYWPEVVNCPNKKPECYRCKGPHKVVNCPKKKLECYLCYGPHKLVNCPTKKAINELLASELKSQNELIGRALAAKKTVEGVDSVKESMVDKETVEGIDSEVIDSVRESVVDKETVKGIDLVMESMVDKEIDSMKESMVDKKTVESFDSVKESMFGKETVVGIDSVVDKEIVKSFDSANESMVDKETVVGIESVKESTVGCILKKLEEAFAWVKTEVKALFKLLSESLVNGLLSVKSFVINCCQKFKQVLASINRPIESGVVTFSEPMSDKKPESFLGVKISDKEAENSTVKELLDVLEKNLQNFRNSWGFHAEISIWVNLIVGFIQLLRFSIAQREKLMVYFVIEFLNYLRTRKQATRNTKKYECSRGQEAAFAIRSAFALVDSAFFG